MRVSMAGVTVVSLLVALLAAVVLGIGNQPLPTEAELTLVEIAEGTDGQPRVLVREGPARDLGRLVDGSSTAVVAHDQLICVGGSLTDAALGDPVSVQGIVEVRDSTPPTIIADRVVVECGAGRGPGA